MLSLALVGTIALAAPDPSGRFVPTQSAAEVEHIRSVAVDEAAAQVAWVLRPLARPRLTAVATACPGYEFTVDGDRFRVQCDGKPAFDWTVGRTGSWTADDGKVLTVALTRRDSTFVLDFTGPDGGKSFTYSFGEQGSLRVTQTVSSAHLGTPMRWTLAYRRAE